MRILLVAALCLAACEQEYRDPNWRPLEILPEAEKALRAELGDQVTFIVTPTSRAAAELGWICGMATLEKGETRFFVYDKAAKELTIQPSAEGDLTMQEGLALGSFMQFKELCERRD